MSSTERHQVERSIRRAEYAHTLVAGVLVMLEEDIDDLRRALASDRQSRLQAYATRAERRVSIPAQRKGDGE
jgi:hypothetical protein